jgi:hypothetical protein
LSVVGNPRKCILFQLDVVVAEKRFTMGVVLLHSGWQLEGYLDVPGILRTKIVIVDGGSMCEVSLNSILNASANSSTRCSKVKISLYLMLELD